MHINEQDDTSPSDISHGKITPRNLPKQMSHLLSQPQPQKQFSSQPQQPTYASHNTSLQHTRLPVHVPPLELANISPINAKRGSRAPIGTFYGNSTNKQTSLAEIMNSEQEQQLERDILALDTSHFRTSNVSTQKREAGPAKDKFLE